MAKAVLDYPFEKPALGTTTEVAPGVIWIRMPLPFRLDHVNLWAIKDGEGWAIVDTGLRNEAVQSTWEIVLQSALGGQPVTKVICTHRHADHIGMAGWLVSQFGCELWITQREYEACKELLVPESAPPEAKIEFYRRAGWSQNALDDYHSYYGGFGEVVHPLPPSYRTLSEDDQLLIGERGWQVLLGEGHTDAHACLYCSSLGLFISGDQVLPKITSNVSVPSLEPDTNPMDGWLRTLVKLKRKVDQHVLVLPSHNECFYGLHNRLDELLEIQHRLLSEVLVLLKKPHRAVDLFECLFGRPITMADGFLLTMATGESVANLNYLVADGRVVRRSDEHGIDWYQVRGH